MHIGHRNTCAHYSIGGVQVGNICYGRDLGVATDESLNYNKQCETAVLSANSFKGILSTIFTCECKANILDMRRSLVRTDLEHCCQVWRP